LLRKRRRREGRRRRLRREGRRRERRRRERGRRRRTWERRRRRGDGQDGEGGALREGALPRLVGQCSDACPATHLLLLLLH
jgi:hypothetical protein